MENKKVLIISVVAVIVLVLAIIATSYATFTANLYGTKDNAIKTGYVKMNCAETVMEVSDLEPMTDAQGIAAEDNIATCALSFTMNGEMTINYDIGFTEVSGTGLSTSDVKFQAYKKIGSQTAEAQYLPYVKTGPNDSDYTTPSSAVSGVTFASIASVPGYYVTGSTAISSYAFDSGQVSSTTTIYYTIKAWVTNSGSNSELSSSNKNNVCTDDTYTTQESCESHGEIWGDSQLLEQGGSSFSFKLKIASSQADLD